MRAIILAESSHCDLSPLTTHTPHALLPLSGKSILVHVLEALQQNCIRKVEIVAPTLHRELEAALSTENRLGMSLRFAPRMLDLRHLPEHCLIIGLENLVDVDWDELFEEFYEVDELGQADYHTFYPVKVLAHGELMAMLIPPDFDEKVSCDWSEIIQTDAVQVMVSPEHLLKVSSIPTYHEANFQLLQGKYKYIKPAGRLFTTGHVAAPRAYVNKRSLKSSHGYFGYNSKVDKSASLCGRVILGDNVVVDKGARVSDSIILGSTYIGANTNCTNSIIGGNLMIRVDTGACIELDDPMLFSAIT
jgi:NDP-sugar pyrophosphorylase family protein